MTRYDCQTCGACCMNRRENRDERFIDYVEIAARERLLERPGLLRKLTVVNDLGERHMKLVGREQRCIALEGKLGVSVTCTIYELRPRPCRTVEAGSRECRAARKERGL